MKNSHSVSRRRFLSTAAAAAAGAVIVPRHVLGAAGELPPSEKVNVAFVGVGAQGVRVMLELLADPAVQAVAVCDANKQAGDYPQWSENEFCQSVRKLLGVSSGWEWLSPDQPIHLTRSLHVTGGAAGREPCRQIVDAYYAAGKRSGKYQGCVAYADFRQMLDKEKGIDAVVVGTPDHLHAAVSIAAMKKGKHVYCQKPLTRTVDEARRVAEVAKQTGVATQIAVANQASEATRRLCEWVWSGAIGPVRQVVNWSSRPFWPQAMERPKETPAVPEGLDWDLWLGPARERPYHPVYLPFSWRGWRDFGCGALGDMGCYSFDTIFRVLKLQAPTGVEASSTDRYAETYPAASIVHFDFAARGEMPPVRLTWYDGGLRPASPEELGNEPLAAEGLLFVGNRGKILCDFTGDKPRLLPESRMKDFQEPPKSLPRSPGHYREWLDACKGGKQKPGGNFEFSATVTEGLLLGNVALASGQRVVVDAAGPTNVRPEAAQALIESTPRKGWEL